MASVIANLNNRVEDLIKEQLNGLLSDDDLSQLVKEKVDSYLETEIPERIRTLSTRFFADKKDYRYTGDETDCYFQQALTKTLKEKTNDFMEAIKNDPRWVVSVDEKGYPIIGEFLKELLAMDPDAIPNVATMRNSLALAKDIVSAISMSASIATSGNSQYDPAMMMFSNNLYRVVDELTKKYLGSATSLPLLASPEKSNDEPATSS